MRTRDSQSLKMALLYGVNHCVQSCLHVARDVMRAIENFHIVTHSAACHIAKIARFCKAVAIRN